jgi:2-polyprenyl-3-methyl-5-hydroxy-6-metoxy-1,4-benzoquinol methylase
MSTEAQPDSAGFETLEIFSAAPRINRWLYEKVRGNISGQVLEIGSGIGNISALLLEEQSAVTLSDLRPEYCQILEKKFRHDPHLQGIYSLDLSLPEFEIKHSLLLEKFDTVIALNVIEHIEDDSLTVRNAKSLLRKNGKLVVLVPAGQWLYNSLDRALGHYKRYSRSELKKLMESAGMIVVYCRYFNAPAILGWWFSGSIMGEKVISPSKLNVFNKGVPVFRILDWFFTPFTGISVISTGIKN